MTIAATAVTTMTMTAASVTTTTMARPYANTLAGMAKVYSHVARYYDLV